MKKKIAATVVLYNPEENVVDNIKTYSSYVDAVFIIDNSPEDNYDLINKIVDKDNVFYHPFNKNMGIAKALNKAITLAQESDFEWLLTMDQDSCFSPEMIQSYVNCFDHIDNIENVSIIACNYFNPDMYKLMGKEQQLDSTLPVYDYADCFMTITSGNLLNLKLVDKTGGFEEKLFIDNVDHDYCLKSKTLGYRVIQFNNIYLNHKLGNVKKVKRFFYFPRSGIVIIHSPVRVYYMARNTCYLVQKYYKYYPKELKSWLKHLIPQYFIAAILFSDNNRQKIVSLIKGLVHFCQNKYGE